MAELRNALDDENTAFNERMAALHEQHEESIAEEYRQEALRAARDQEFRKCLQQLAARNQS